MMITLDLNSENTKSDMSKFDRHSRIKTRIFKKQIVPTDVKENEIYVTRKRPLIVYYNRAIKLLTTTMYHNTIYSERLGCRRNKKMIRNNNESGQNSVVIHGMGACIMTAIWLAQDLKSNFGEKVSVETNTSTIKVMDEHVNEDREWESYAKIRYLSIISIKITLNDVNFTCNKH
ncbi:hypothetical protein FG379_000236 [Cryptosporidium bovis]|uniref:uncharacterized protein n=1 Tax=Cryptosporidium bovis TaxID=310047 RepID=UPI003519FB21|nr:hypothetical protein FG379_000236 [Cryptosporidium bovis]